MVVGMGVTVGAGVDVAQPVKMAMNKKTENILYVDFI